MRSAPPAITSSPGMRSCTVATARAAPPAPNTHASMPRSVLALGACSPRNRHRHRDRCARSLGQHQAFAAWRLPPRQLQAPDAILHRALPSVRPPILAPRDVSPAHLMSPCALRPCPTECTTWPRIMRDAVVAQLGALSACAARFVSRGAISRGWRFAIRTSRTAANSFRCFDWPLRQRSIARTAVRASPPRSPSSRRTTRLRFAVSITISYQHRSRVREYGPR